MLLLQSNHRIIATYGVGSGNAPTLTMYSVGHLRVAFFNFLKIHSYVYKSEAGNPCSSERRPGF